MEPARGAHAVAWIALIIAIIAVILAWTAFNRSGGDIEALVEERVESAASELRADYESLEAELRADFSDLNNDNVEDENATTTP